jgi:hypothetical protein
MCVRKVLAYKHEAEVRAMVWIPNESFGQTRLIKPGQEESWENSLRNFVEQTPKGLEIPVDFAQLVTDIWFGPREKQWIRDLVRQIMKRYAFSQDVIASSLLQPRI